MPPQNPGIPRQIAVIHTVSGLISLFDSLAKRHLPQWHGFNMLDESLLRGMTQDGPAVSSLVFGGRTEAQFRDNFAAVLLNLSSAEICAPDRG